MKKLLLLLLLLGITPNVFGKSSVFDNLDKEIVFNEVINPKDMKVKHFFGFDKMNNPIILSDEFDINYQKTKGYVDGIIDFVLEEYSINGTEKECIIKTKENLMKQFQNDILSGNELIVDEVKKYIFNCLERKNQK